MYLKKIDGPRAVTLADGSMMTRADLPPAATRRWVASRKAAVVRAVRIGLITPDEAQKTWALSEEELAEWVAAVDSHGVDGLKTTLTQKHRQP